MSAHIVKIEIKNISVMRMMEIISNKILIVWMIFFFSSRRRHTRWSCDWSSDVCSSDLLLQRGGRVLQRLDADVPREVVERAGRHHPQRQPVLDRDGGGRVHRAVAAGHAEHPGPARRLPQRSEGRRVGEELRGRSYAKHV